MLSHTNDVILSYHPREGNGVADRVAKKTLSFENYDPKLYSIVPRWAMLQVEVDNRL